MTEAQRVGQLFIVGIASDDPGSQVAAQVRRYHFGSLLFGGNHTKGEQVIARATAIMQSAATRSATARVRFFIAANQEGGQIQPLVGPGFAAMPSALDQGSLSTAQLREQARIWGGELRSAGVNLDLAPVMDVVPKATAAQNQPIGALDREFGYDPVTNGKHGAAFITGMREAGVATAAKHFPGLGRVRGNTDFAAGVNDTVTTANDPYLRSFRSAIGTGVPFVMVALATYTRIDPTQLAVFSPRVITGLLRQRMGFTGVIMSDDLGEAVAVASSSPGSRALRFLRAGGDMITTQDLAPAISMQRAVLSAASTSPSFRSTIRTAVLRVLTAKQAFGLLPCGNKT